MTSHPADNSKQICEQILLDEKQYNINNHILPSETVIVDRLLGRGLELKDVYQELHGKLAHHPGALQTFLGQVLTTAAFWNPEKIREARSARDDLEETNRKIASKAAELADLFQRRKNLHNTSGFTSDTHYHVCEVLKAAAGDNHLFTSRVQKRFEELHTQFDLKYWPTLSDFMHELASDADAAAPEASDPLTEVATSARRSSLGDFFKALFVAISENSARNHGRLPDDFRLTDATLATIVNCALDLGPEELVDSIYVKGLRQRERGRSQ
ncbi:hypothetical protein [Pseudoduganella aquatica]|uniref:hypothetical protein n=1 Tax=Pseudoduganella aquatica TaxID=2660641 RepID=UPI001E6417C3|nr:hypothetical protein [Pseudoduganella aquatica]